MKIANMFKNWTLFEKIWIVTSVTVITILCVIWNDTPIGFISTISGIICVVLAAKGKIATFYFGAVQAGTYAYIAYGYGLYGEAMLNAFFFLPFQIIGWVLWFKNRKKAVEATNGEDVHAKKLTKKQWFILTPIVLAAIGGYWVLLEVISATQPGLDSAAVVLSIFAQLLMTFRFAEQWIMWIAVNVITITVWFFTLVNSGGNDWAVFAMWCAFLVNSVYGYLNWRKLANAEQKTVTPVDTNVKVAG